MFNRHTVISAWGVVGLLVVVVGIENWQPMTTQLKETGTKLAVTYMRDSVRRIQHQWMLQGEPQQLEFEQQTLTLNDHGLLTIEDEYGNPNCEYWLKVHYPQKDIMNSELLKISFIPDAVGYNCYFRYSGGDEVVVKLTKHSTALTVTQWGQKP